MVNSHLSHHFIISSNGLKIPFNGYTYDPYFADNLEAILKELTGLKFAEPAISYVKPKSDEKKLLEHKSHRSIAEDIANEENIELNITQLLYQFISCIIILASTIVNPTQLNEQAQMGFIKKQLRTLANIFFLYVQDIATAEHKVQSDEPPMLPAFSSPFLLSSLLLAQHTNIFSNYFYLEIQLALSLDLKLSLLSSQEVIKKILPL